MRAKVHAVRTRFARRRSLERKLTACALASGAVLGAGEAARAGIVYSGPQNILITTIQNAAGYNLDLNGDSVTDFIIKDTGLGAGGLFDQLTVQSLGSNGVVNSSPGFAAALTLDTLISPASPFQGGTLIMSQRKPDQGQWLGASHKFLGLRFRIPGQGTHFGWAQLSAANVASNRINATLEGWAYETRKDVGIRAGATTVAPEPSSAVLTLCGLGAAGVVVLKRRRPTA
jgi:hypothetical protein